MIKKIIPDSADCVVIGGGPAGSTAATMLAREGLKTVVFERSRFPRPHVGESLMPAANAVFKELGVAEKLSKAGFPNKIGVQFASRSGKETSPFIFGRPENGGLEDTWHVERSVLDQILLEHSAECGATVLEGFRVQKVIFGEDNEVVGVRVTDDAGNPVEVLTSLVVDASGQQSFLANKLGVKEFDTCRKNASIWTYYDSAVSMFSDQVLTLIAQTECGDCWFWHIPISENRVSLGLVGPREIILTGDLEAALESKIEACPAIRKRLQGLRRGNELHVARDFAYTATNAAGNGWVLVGDALGFIDPVYSTGVFLAIKSAQLAAENIITSMSRGDLSGNSLGQWYSDYKMRVSWLRTLVELFYDNSFHFGDFIRTNPSLASELASLLTGNVFDRDARDFIKAADSYRGK